MIKKLPVVIAFLISPIISHSQTDDKIAHEAFMITRMVNKFHVQPREVNDQFSADVFSGMLLKADPDKVFFLKADIDRLSVYTGTIDDEIKQQKTAYLHLFTNIYQQRLRQADSIVTGIVKQPFDFNTPGRFTEAEQISYPASSATLRQKWVKRLKTKVLEALVYELPDGFKSLTLMKQKRYTDSAVNELSKKVAAAQKREINNILQHPYGITQYVGNMYCETIASCYDPHTEFFPPDVKENFESMLGGQSFQFGFKIKPDKNGGVLIDNLEPGSPAFKGGKLNKGDKFLSLQWEDRDPVDVTDISINEFSILLSESNHKKVLFTVKKADGAIIKVLLAKEQVTGNGGDKVNGLILKGDNTIGYIYLPAFYEDWNVNDKGLNGCANDVGREILKLKKENINGLILDLRYNGGGSAEEATELAGLFIDAGPVAQSKERGPKVYVMNDINRGTVYDGPLVILVNGYSASASELIAGALQDYNRAVIIGSPTYGKATAQVVFPMDTTVTPATIAQKRTENYLKITISKLYRVNGTTAQFSGVQPDINLPDILDAFITKEAGEPFALRPTFITPNKYYIPYKPLPIQALASSVQAQIDANRYFKAVKDMVAYSRQKRAKDISLDIKDAVNNNFAKNERDNAMASITPSKRFIVQNNQYKIARMQTDSYLKELNEEFSRQVSADPYISIAYDVLGQLKNQ